MPDPASALITETRPPSVLTNRGAITSDQEDADGGAQDPICRLWIRRASTARSVSGVAVPAARARAMRSASTASTSVRRPAIRLRVSDDVAGDPWAVRACSVTCNCPEGTGWLQAAAAAAASASTSARNAVLRAPPRWRRPLLASAR